MGWGYYLKIGGLVEVLTDWLCFFSELLFTGVLLI